MYSASTSFKKDSKKEWKIPPESEFRFEVDWNEKIQITLKSGKAEIFGAEIGLLSSLEYFGGTKLAIFSWQGCVLEVLGDCKSAYVASETPMNSILNIHLALETLRRKGTNGPKVIIVGPNDSGKTTCARILSSYACRASRLPVYVDLDPNDGNLMLPTSIGAVVVDRLDSEERNGFDFTTAPPLLYSFGHNSPSTNITMYKKLVAKLSNVTKRRLDEDESVRSSGMIIDTHPWLDNIGTELFLHQLDAFEAGYVIVVGQEKLFNEIKILLETSRPNVKILSVAKSGGVSNHLYCTKKHMQMQRVREYFYGTPKSELSPFTTSVSFAEVSVRRIAECILLRPDLFDMWLIVAHVAPLSTLPIGEERKVNETQLIKIENGSVLLHTVLALSNAVLPFHATDKDEESLPETNIAGFVYVYDDHNLNNV